MKALEIRRNIKKYLERFCILLLIIFIILICGYSICSSMLLNYNQQLVNTLEKVITIENNQVIIDSQFAGEHVYENLFAKLTLSIGDNINMNYHPNNFWYTCIVVTVILLIILRKIAIIG